MLTSSAHGSMNPLALTSMTLCSSTDSNSAHFLYFQCNILMLFTKEWEKVLVGKTYQSAQFFHQILLWICRLVLVGPFLLDRVADSRQSQNEPKQSQPWSRLHLLWVSEESTGTADWTAGCWEPRLAVLALLLSAGIFSKATLFQEPGLSSVVEDIMVALIYPRNAHCVDSGDQRTEWMSRLYKPMGKGVKDGQSGGKRVSKQPRVHLKKLGN